MDIDFEQAAYLVGILAAFASGIAFLVKHRNTSIDEARAILAKTWTNEGDISCQDKRFVTLQLELNEGDLIGNLHSPRLKNPLEAHVYPGWFSARLELSSLNGRSLTHIATIRISLRGNRNRLKWRVISGPENEIFPKSSLLWPCNVGVA